MIYILFLFLILNKINSLTYFWLDHDSVISASQYCDQHCFKIASEIVIALWCVVKMFNFDLYKLATKENIPFAYRKIVRKHTLILWTGLCRANFKKSIDNADAILNEHYARTKKKHSVRQDIDFLKQHYEKIDFNVKWWDIWVVDQSGSIDLLVSESINIIYTIDTNKSVYFEDRNKCAMTHPPLIFDEIFRQEFKEKNPQIDFTKGSYHYIIEAYRYYYKTKMYSVKTKKSKKNESKYVGNLRYFYSKYPEWLLK